MTKKVGSAGRFGARYGKTVKEKVTIIEKKQKKKQKCPYCKSISARRLSMGIFFCKKCNAKFTGGAYTVQR